MKGGGGGREGEGMTSIDGGSETFKKILIAVSGTSVD